MGQREAIAFGEGVATTMRLKFEKLSSELIPGVSKRAAEAASAGSDEVDLAAVVERLRNVPRPQAALGFADTVDAQKQAGDFDYRKPASRPQPDDDFDTRFGLRPTTFGGGRQTAEVPERSRPHRFSALTLR